MADLDTNYLESGEGDGTIIDNEPKNMEGSTAITTDPNPYETHKRKSEA